MSRPAPLRALAPSVALLLCATPLVASGQSRGPRALSVGIGGGATVPVGALATDVTTGWNGLAFFQYQPAGEGPWAVRAEAQRNRAPYTDAFRTETGVPPASDADNTIDYVGASALYHVAGRAGGLRPYVIGGLGLYQLTARVREGGATASDTEAGFGFNGGVGLRLGRQSALFLEARFHQFSVTPAGGVAATSRFVPLAVGVTF